jgi:glycosyltransferase involved in cell wall biosynthesis
MIRAAKFLVRRGHKIKVVLAGEGRDRQMLENIAAELNLKDVVSFLGFVEKMEDFYAGLDIFVFCSEWEGMPNSVLEAMASGKPVVAADIPVVRELIEDGKSGLIYPARNVADLAELIERIIRDPELASKLSQAAIERVAQNFDERKIMAGFREELKTRRKSK